MDEEFLKNLYWNEKLSSIKIGHKLGVAPRTVLHWMVKFKIPRRSLSEALKGEKSPMYGKHLSKETRKKLSEAQKGEKNNLYGKKLSEEHRRKISESHKEKKNPMYGKPPSIEHRRKISEAKKGRPLPEEHRRNISASQKGEKNSMYGTTGKHCPSWRGGISFELYPQEFNEALKEKIYKRDNYTCQICFKKESRLIHHIDYDKKNNVLLNLVALCKKCHGKTNHNRKEWINYFKTVLLQPQPLEAVG